MSDCDRRFTLERAEEDSGGGLGFDGLWFPPPAGLSAAGFEQFVAESFGALRTVAPDLRIELHEVIRGTDGEFDFDATVRYELAGMQFLIIVEAKHHTNSIKRDVVQTLDSKVRSVGAHKGVVFSTAPFQRGAIEFATTHGIALVKVTEGRFTFITRGSPTSEAIGRARARQMGIPDLVGHSYVMDDGVVTVGTVTGDLTHAAKHLLHVPSGPAALEVN